MITGGGALRETQGEGGNARIAAGELNASNDERGPAPPKPRLPIRIADAAFQPDGRHMRLSMIRPAMTNYNDPRAAIVDAQERA
jgi:hypothetical protein